MHLLTRIIILIVLFLTGCAAPATPTPDRPPQGDVTPTPLPTPAGWTRASAPIGLTNISRLRELGTLTVPEPPSTVFAHALALDNTRLYGLNNTYLLGWDVLTGERLFATQREDATRVFVSPDRRRLYTIAPSLIRVYASDTGFAVENFRALESYQSVAAYEPLRGLLALGGTDGAIQVWDMTARAALGILRAGDSPITTLTFNPDGTVLTAADETGAVLMWDIATLELLTSNSIGQTVGQLMYSADGQLLVADSQLGAIRLSVEDLGFAGGMADRPSGGLFGWAGQTNILFQGGADGVTLWDVASGELAATLPDTRAERVSIATSPDGALMMVATLNGGASLWNLSNIAQGTVLRGALRVDDPTLRDLLWTPDSFQIFMFTTRGPIRVWGVAN